MNVSEEKESKSNETCCNLTEEPTSIHTDIFYITILRSYKNHAQYMWEETRLTPISSFYLD